MFQLQQRRPTVSREQTKVEQLSSIVKHKVKQDTKKGFSYTNNEGQKVYIDPCVAKSMLMLGVK